MTPQIDEKQERIMSAIRPLQSPLNRPIRLAVLISGGGTTLTNLLRAIEAGELDAEVSLVIASRRDCAGIDKAHQAGLPCRVVARTECSSTAEFSEAIFSQCREATADLVVLAGFLSLVTIPDDFTLRVMNIHPALIPAFCGKGFHGQRVHEAVLARGCKFSGCTVHFADNEYDHGPIIVQRVVDVFPDDTPETLADRVFAEECVAYPEAIRLFASAQLEVSGCTVRNSRSSG